MDETRGDGMKERRRPGPTPGPSRRKVNVLLEEDLSEWGKRQPGGLSELTRRLLREERQRRCEEETQREPVVRGDGD